MAKRTGPTNPNLKKLIRELRKLGKKENVRFWSRIADELERPTRIRREINVWKIDKYAKDNEIIVVPGKVLGEGETKRKIKVAAFKFSESAKNKLECLSLEELMKTNPKAKGVRILC